MADKKELPLALLEILTKYTDHDHYLSTAEMTEILHSEYGLTLERRTLYSNMDLLKKYGHKISTWKDNGYGYCLTEHQFTEKEVSVLIELLRNCNGLSRREREKLTKNCSTR